MNSMQRACDTRCRRSLQRCGSCSMRPSNFKYRGVECCPLPHAAAQVAHMRAQTAAGTVRARRALRQVEQPTLAAQESHMSLMLLFLTRQILRAGSPIKFDVRDCQWHWTPSLRAVPLVDMFHFATHCCKRLASKAGSGGQGASGQGAIPRNLSDDLDVFDRRGSVGYANVAPVLLSAVAARAQAALLSASVPRGAPGASLVGANAMKRAREALCYGAAARSLERATSRHRGAGFPHPNRSGRELRSLVCYNC